jgi:1-deoxy-D-xylulose-5-phosphate synthase
LKAEFKHRVFDVGIAEQHAAAFCAGLASQGLKPVLCIYSTFLQRAYDQVIHDIALPGLPVVLGIDRSGLVGADGATHQGAYDCAFLRPVPGLSQLAPVVGGDIVPMLSFALSAKGPTAIRFPRGTLPQVEDGLAKVSLPKARFLKHAGQPELTFVTLGPLGLTALEAAHAEPPGASWMHPRWSHWMSRACSRLPKLAPW